LQNADAKAVSSFGLFFCRIFSVRGAPKFTEYTVPYSVAVKKEEEKRNSTSIATPLSPEPARAHLQSSLPEKLIALKKWAHTTIQSELRPRLNDLQDRANKISDIQQIVAIAQQLKLIKPVIFQKKKKKTAPRTQVVCFLLLLLDRRLRKDEQQFHNLKRRKWFQLRPRKSIN
jgi:hypothetical protein